MTDITDTPPVEAAPPVSPMEAKLERMSAAVAADPEAGIDVLRDVAGDSNFEIPSDDDDDQDDDASDDSDDSARNDEADDDDDASDDDASGTDDDDGDDDDGADATEAAVKLSLPSRETDGDDIEFEIPVAVLEAAGLDAENIQKRINQMRNGYVRASKIKDFEKRSAQLQEVEDSIENDPIGFLTERITSTDVRKAVTQALLLELDDDDRRELLDAGAEYDDEDARQAAKDRAELARRRAADKKAEEDKGKPSEADAENATKIGNAIVDIIPDDWKQPRQARFFREAVTELRAHLAQNPELERLDPATVAEILSDSGLLDQFSISTPSDDSDDAAPDASKKKKTRKKTPMERAAARKKLVTTPAGAGAEASSGLNLPKGQKVADRINTLAKHFGVKLKP